MPRDAVPEPGRPRRDPQGSERRRCSSSRASTSATSPSTRPKKPFDDVRVRQAINMAINKKAIIEAVYLAPASRRRTRSRRRMWSYNDADQGRPVRSGSGEEAAGRGRLSRTASTTDLWAMPVQRPYNPNAKRIAELMQADLAKVGVKAEIKSFEWGEYRKRMQAGEHQMGMLGWTGDNGDPDNFLVHAARLRRGQEQRQQRREVVLPAVRGPDPEGEDRRPTRSERTELYEKAQVIFKEQAPWFTIAHAVQFEAGAQGSRRLQAARRSAPQLLRRRHQG